MFFILFQLREEQLDIDLEKEKDLFEIVDKIREHTTESVGEELMMELTDLDNMKRTIKVEFENRIENLAAEKQRWKSYNDNRFEFEGWLKKTEDELKNLSTNAIDLNTPAKFQVMFPVNNCFPR